MHQQDILFIWKRSVIYSVLVSVVTMLVVLLINRRYTYYEMPLITLFSNPRPPRTGDIFLCSAQYADLMKYFTSGIASWAMNSPANHAGIFWVTDAPYVMHRTNQGKVTQLLSDMGRCYCKMTVVRINPSPDPARILKAYQEMTDRKVNEFNLVYVFFNYHLRNADKIIYKDQIYSCSRMVVEILIAAGVCRPRYPLDSITPKDMLSIYDPAVSVLEPIPPYTFLPPVSI